MKGHDLTTDVWRVGTEGFPTDAPHEERARFLLRYAILAPSSHNSQPWKFVVDDDTIEVHADEARWLDVADQDKRELYISLGCAVENLRVAAERFGLDYHISYHDDAPPVIVRLQPERRTASGPRAKLFDQLTERSTNHHLFRNESLGDEIRAELQDCVIEDDVTFDLIDDSERKNAVAQLQAEADRLQMDDPDYRRELGYWLGIGALGGSWLKARVGQAVVTYLDIGDSEAKKNSKLITSTPIVGVLSTESDAPSARVRTGQVFERLALAATGKGVAVHPMSQIPERPEKREELASLIDGDDKSPQHLFRLGFPQESQDHTPRWPVEAFLVDQS